MGGRRFGACAAGLSAAGNQPCISGVPFLTEEAGKEENCHLFARVKRKQSMNGHNLASSWVNLCFIPITECIP